MGQRDTLPLIEQQALPSNKRFYSENCATTHHIHGPCAVEWKADHNLGTRRQDSKMTLTL